MRRFTPAPPHRCHWPKCDQIVPPSLWGCKRHWYMLPYKLRTGILQAYRPGQERTKTPSKEYQAAARAVQDWIRGQYDPGASHGTR